MSTKDVKIKTGNLLNNFEPEVREITSQLSKVKLNLTLFIKRSVKNSFLIDVFIDAEMHFFF